MSKILANRSFAILIVFCLLISALAISSIINAYTLTEFKDGSTSLTATLPGPVSMEIQVPADANVTTAQLDVSTVQYGNKYPRNPELRITDISDPVVWAYKAVGYGDLGHQIYFNNSVATKEMEYRPSTIDRTTGIYLPKGATIKSARLNLTAIEYDYWEPGVIQLNPADWGNNPPSDMDPHLAVWDGKLICFYRSYNWDVTNQTDGDLVLNYSTDGVNWLPAPREISKHPDTEIPYLGGLRCGDYHPAAVVKGNDLWVTWASQSDYTNQIGFGNFAGITDGIDRDIVIRKINNLNNPTTPFTEITHPTLNAAEDTYSNNDDTFLLAKDDRRAQITEFTVDNKLYVTWIANNTGNETFTGNDLRIGDIMVSSSSDGLTWSPGINLCAGDPWYAVDYWTQIVEFKNKLYVMWVTNDTTKTNGTDWDIVYRSSSDGTNWGPYTELTPIDDGDWSDDDCQLVVYNGELYTIWRTRNDQIAQGPDFDIVMRSTSNGNTWGPISEVGYVWNGAFDNKPDPIVFDNELYVLWRTEMGGEGDFFVRSYHDGDWTEQQQLNPRKGNGDNFYITAAVFKNKLYAAWVTEDDELTEDDDYDVVIRSMTPSNLPLLVKLDIGADGGTYDYNSGLTTTTVTLDIKSKLQELVDNPPSSVYQFTDQYGNEMVNISLPLDITGPGKVKFNGLDIVYDATLTTRNFNDHVNEYLKNRQETAVDGQITVPMTISAQNDAKLKLSNLEVTYSIKPTITLLTPPAGNDEALNNQYFINWTDYDPDTDAMISLYYDDDKKNYDGVLIAKDISEDSSNDYYHWTWNASSMVKGNYYVYAIINDGSDTMRKYSTGYVFIDPKLRQPPSIGLTYPKYKDELAWKSYEIKWNDEDGDDNAKITLWYNTLPLGDDWLQIDTNGDDIIDTDDFIYEDPDGDSDSYTWDISGFPEGNKYIVRAEIDDGYHPVFPDDCPGNILITQIPEPINISIVGGNKISPDKYETHDLFPQLEWEKPDIPLELNYFGKVFAGPDEIFDFDTSDTTYPISTKLEYGKSYDVKIRAESLLGAKSPNATMTFDVVNNLPTAPQITIKPSTPYTSNSLRCEITNNSVDNDGDPVEYMFQWYKNGVLQEDFNDIANIPSDKTSKNDVWICEVTPFDGIEYGIAAEISVKVLNSRPKIIINSPESGFEAKTSDPILFSGSVTDLDNDVVGFEITSSIDGTLKSESVPGGGGLFTLSKKLSAGEHNITIWATDGYSNVTTTFQVTIKKVSEETEDTTALIAGLIIIVIIIIIIGVLLVLRRRRRRGEEIPPPMEPYPSEEGEGGEDDSFDEYGEFKKQEDKPHEIGPVPPPETPK